MKIRFLIYGLVGWWAETVFTGIGSLLKGDLTMFAFTYIWMFPIYGLLVFMEPVHDRMRRFPVVLRGGVYMMLIFAAEFATGGILKGLIGQCPWNYGSGRYTIDGIVTLSFAPVWFAGGLAFERLHDILIRNSVGELK